MIPVQCSDVKGPGQNRLAPKVRYRSALRVKADKPGRKEGVQRLAVNVQCLAFNVQRSPFAVRRRSQDIGNTYGSGHR
jgi:hypothetical protein